MDDREYHKQRATQEFRMGCAASDRRAAAAHFQLFSMHAEHARALNLDVGNQHARSPGVSVRDLVRGS